MSNAFYFGDNLHILREYIPDESVDLVYLDPPFNSNATYNLLFKSPDKSKWDDAQITTFDDTWVWGDAAEETFDDVVRTPGRAADVLTSLRLILGTNDMLAYLTMMAARLVELRRVMKPTGSLFLHCDPTASHYLKVMLDGIFGPKQFRNEIIWRRTGSHNSTKRFGPVHDTILYYTASDRYTFHRKVRPYMQGHVEKAFVKDGASYRTNYSGNILTGSGTRRGLSGQPWMGFDPTSKGRHWALPGKLIEGMEDEFEGLDQRQKFDKLYEMGIITINDGDEWPRYSRQIGSNDGQYLSDIWAYQPYTEGTVFGTDGGVDEDVRWMGTKDAERLGYPTQKPLGLLRRIIESASNEGDRVLDPFCGCGTTVHAAHELGREWTGIDVAVQSMRVVQDRLKHHFPSIEYEVYGIPKSTDGALWLAANDPFKFEEWAVNAIGAMHSGKFRGDGGIDGMFYYLVSNDDRSRGIVSVKGGRSLNPGMVRDLGGTVQTQRKLTRDERAIGVLICAHEPTKGMREAAREFGKVETLFGHVPAVQILTVREMFEGARVQVPAMLDTVTAAKLGRKKSVNAAFRKPQDLTQPSFMLPIRGGLDEQPQTQEETPVPVMPSFRARHAAG